MVGNVRGAAPQTLLGLAEVTRIEVVAAILIAVGLLAAYGAVDRMYGGLVEPETPAQQGPRPPPKWGHYKCTNPKAADNLRPCGLYVTEEYLTYESQQENP